MTNLEALQKLVTQHEVKIDDLTEEVKNEANKKKKKELETALKKLQTDEKYLKALEEIREEEARLKREAERALLSKASETKAKGATAGKTSKAEKADVAPVVADEATMAQIDAAFANNGKDGVDAKALAVANLEALASATAFVLSRMEKLIPLFDHSKLGAPAVKAASAIASAMSPKGHGIATLVMTALLPGIEDKRWKVKAGCIQVLLPCLKQMEGATPAQLAECLPPIVTKLAEAALEVRAEIRNATGAVLKEIGSLVASPEIKELSADLVTALAEPTNQKHTQGVLARMGNQTFKSTIDEASLALLLPIVLRGLKDREAMSKKWSAQILGSTAMLVKDTEFLRPYLRTVVPLLQAALMDSVPEVQREGAKAFGVLEQVLPEFSRLVNQPWLFGRLRSGDSSEQIGAALAIAEVCVRMEKSRLTQLIPEIEKGARHESWAVRRGFLELMDTMPQALKMDFTSFIERLFPTMLMGITGDKDPTEDPALKAAGALVARFGDLCPDLLLPAFEDTYAITLCMNNAAERQQRTIVREKTINLLHKLADKILEHKKFGQDLLTTEDCSNKETRERLICLAFITRYDPDAAVKRIGNGLWKTAGGAPKMQKAIMPALEQMLLRMRSGVRGSGAQKVALEVLADLAKAGDLEAPTDEVPAAVDLDVPAPVSVSEEAARIVAGTAAEASEAVAGEASSSGGERTARVVEEHLARCAGFAALPSDVRAHCAVVTASVVREGLRRKSGGPQLVAELVKSLEDVMAPLADAAAAAKGELPTSVEAAVRALLGDAFDATADAAGDSDLLMRVENMLLMYGAGKLLLKDTMLEMKANRRYGVVGHNGAGKTTLMKEIVNGRIVGMPTNLKCVHVDDSKLGEMSKSSLNAWEYVVKKALEIGVQDVGRDTLLSVGFPERMFEEPVAELSTGWRMRLTLAVSMLKHADIVLLDEPTNHLDEESVEWLSDYLLTLNKSSVMVISHEPKFLNKVCTDIISYKDKRLVYTDGNFDAFVAAKGIKANDIEALLSGNLCLDDEVAEEGDAAAAGEGEAKRAAPVATHIAGPPKISFPIPGSVEGVKSSSRAVIEIKNLSFRYSKDKDYLINNVSGKLSLGSRVAICGRNGCGKSTLMTLICSELNPVEGKDGVLGEVLRHCNLRVAYMKQDHLKTLGPYFDTSPLVYITQRFQHGYDEELQKRLIEPEDEEEAERRVALAKIHGKYGNEVESLLGRTKQGTQLVYEVKWKGLDDPKQNTMEPVSKLRAMGLDRVVIACDERIAAKAAGLDQRPLTRREIVKHCEAFGIDEEMCCNQQIRGFSAGQKVRLSLAAMFWTKPHLIALDEPTNYLDVETVEALGKALTTFRGGIVMIEPKSDFVEKVCNETWMLENGSITVQKLNNGNKRTA